MRAKPVGGVEPEENREIPRLITSGLRLKQRFPDLRIIINGGIETLDQTQTHPKSRWVMVGRAAYKTPYFLADIDRLIFGAGEAPLSRDEIVERLIPYAENWSRKNTPACADAAFDGAVSGLPGGRLWRRYLSENAVGANVPATVLQGALDVVQAQRERAALAS